MQTLAGELQDSVAYSEIFTAMQVCYAVSIRDIDHPNYPFYPGTSQHAAVRIYKITTPETSCLHNREGIDTPGSSDTALPDGGGRRNSGCGSSDSPCCLRLQTRAYLRSREIVIEYIEWRTS